MDQDTEIGGGQDRFPLTRGSIIEGVRSDDPRSRERAWELLVAAYWKPIYKHIRMKWGASNEQAKDWTQGFFASAMEKPFVERYTAQKAGFRTYLRVCADRYVANEQKAAGRAKRGSVRMGARNGQVSVSSSNTSRSRPNRRHSRPVWEPPAASVALPGGAGPAPGLFVQFHASSGPSPGWSYDTPRRASRARPRSERRALSGGMRQGWMVPDRNGGSSTKEGCMPSNAQTMIAQTVTANNVIAPALLGSAWCRRLVRQAARGSRICILLAASAGWGTIAWAGPPQGSIVAWGYNQSGQTRVPSPNSSFTAVAAGPYHSLGLRASGSIVGWGSNGSGQTNVPSPNTEFIAFAAREYHSLGLKADGSIVGWGSNGSGQTNVPAPNAEFIAVSTGYSHSLGLKADGSIVGWGSTDSGQTNVPLPNSGFIAIAAGGNHSLGRKANGSIVAWGRNDHGQTNVPSPNAEFIAVVGGGSHSLGLKADGSIVAWGKNDYAQTNVPSPNTGFIAVAAGYSHSLGLKADGSIVAWGRNDYGQTNVPSPNTGFIAVAAGGWNSLAIRAPASAPQCCNPDVDGSGGFTVFDVALVQDCIRGLSNSPPCDVNCDGTVDWCDSDLVVCAFQQQQNYQTACCAVDRCGACCFTGSVCSNWPKIPCTSDTRCSGQPCGWQGLQCLRAWESTCTGSAFNGSWQPRACSVDCTRGVPPVGGRPPTPDLAGVANPPPQKTGLIVLTHGWRSDAAAGGWVANMADAILAAIPPGDAANWRVATVDWSQSANTWTPTGAAGNGQAIGRRIGRYANTQGYPLVHLYGHSAGSHLIDQAQKQLSYSHTQLTFFDSFVPAPTDQSPLGTTAIFAMQYVDIRELGLGSRTAEQFPGAYHLDITQLDDRGLSPRGYNFPAFHAWPYHFYQKTIDERPCGAGTMPPWQTAALGWGFGRAMECNAGVVPSHVQFPKGGAAQAPGPPPTAGLGDPADEPPITYESPVDLATAFVNQQNATVSSAQVNLASSDSDTAAWINFEVVTNKPANYLQFTYEFDSASAYGFPGESWFVAYVDRDGDGTLTDYDLVFQVDELIASHVGSNDNPGNDYSHTYTVPIGLETTLSPGTHLIAFRIDFQEPIESGITGDQSSLVVSNVAFGGTFCPNPSDDTACNDIIVGGQGGCSPGYTCAFADDTCTCTADPPAIPAVSQWGLAVLALLTICAATMVIRRRVQLN